MKRSCYKIIRPIENGLRDVSLYFMYSRHNYMWIWHENRILCIYFTGFNQCQYCMALAVATAAANSIHHKSNSINILRCDCRVALCVWVCGSWNVSLVFNAKMMRMRITLLFSASTSGFLGKFMLSSQVNTPYTQHTLYVHSTSSISQLLLCFFPFFSFSPPPPSSTSALSWLWFIRLAYDPNVSTPNQWQFFHIFVLFSVKTGTNVSRVIDRVWNRFTSLFSLLYLSYFDLIAITIVRYRCGVRFFSSSSCHTRNHQQRFLAWYWTAVSQVDMKWMGERFAYN